MSRHRLGSPAFGCGACNVGQCGTHQPLTRATTWDNVGRILLLSFHRPDQGNDFARLFMLL